MDGVIGPAVVAGGRIAAAALRRPKFSRKASLRLSIEVIDLDGGPVVTMTMKNLRKNLDSVVVTAITPMIRIHDQGCSEPEFLPIRKGQYGQSPACPFTVDPGEVVRWQARFRVGDVRDLQDRYTSEAMRKTWGKYSYEGYLDAERQATELRSQLTSKGRLARTLHAIEDPSPQLLYRVVTKNDGEFRSSFFRPAQSTAWSRLKAAWK